MQIVRLDIYWKSSSKKRAGSAQTEGGLGRGWVSDGAAIDAAEAKAHRPDHRVALSGDPNVVRLGMPGTCVLAIILFI